MCGYYYPGPCSPQASCATSSHTPSGTWSRTASSGVDSPMDNFTGRKAGAGADDKDER